MRQSVVLATFALLAASVFAAADDKPADRTAAAEAFVAAHVKGDFAAAMKDFDDVMKKASPADKMEAAWMQVQTEAGPFQKQLGTRAERTEKYDIVLVTCQFEKMALDVRVVFTRDGQITGYSIRPVQKKYDFKPPAYARREAFRESDVTVGSGQWALPGTLTQPVGDGPFAAVVLVHGSGPHDRDETIGPNKPFRDLAWGLASQGVAVLRYDKRTKAHAAESAKVKDLTVKEEVLDDALAAVTLLRTTKGIDPKKVFVLGHSLGAMAAPRLAQLDPAIAGLVLLASPARPIAEVLIEQLEYVLSLEKDRSEEDQAKVEKIRQDAARLADPHLSREDFASGTLLGASFTYWKSMGDLKPAETATKIEQPLLVLQGGRDYQSTLVDFDLWKKVLARHANADLKSYATLNHLFMEGEGKAKPAEYDKEGHVAAEVIQDIAAWVKNH